MAKKDFTAAAAATAPVYGTIIGATGTYKASEEQKASNVQEVYKMHDEQDSASERKTLAALQTQGQRGAKLDRINMAFTPDNMDFIRTMSKLKGQTMTQFVNIIIARERSQNGKAYEAAKSVLKNL